MNVYFEQFVITSDGHTCPCDQSAWLQEQQENKLASKDLVVLLVGLIPLSFGTQHVFESRSFGMVSSYITYFPC